MMTNHRHAAHRPFLHGVPVTIDSRKILRDRTGSTIIEIDINYRLRCARISRSLRVERFIFR
jgi:hypothetical protein